MLEEKEDGFSREAVVSSVQKWFESSAYKQLRRSKPKSGEDQAFAVTGGGKNHPGRGGSRHGSRKPGGSQGGRGNGGSGRATETAAQAAEVSRVGKLAAAVVAPLARSPGEGRAGCARATSITSVTTSNRSGRGVARGVTT